MCPNLWCHTPPWTTNLFRLSQTSTGRLFIFSSWRLPNPLQISLIHQRVNQRGRVPQRIDRNHLINKSNRMERGKASLKRKQVRMVSQTKTFKKRILNLWGKIPKIRPGMSWWMKTRILNNKLETRLPFLSSTLRFLSYSKRLESGKLNKKPKRKEWGVSRKKNSSKEVSLTSPKNIRIILSQSSNKHEKPLV